MRYLLAFFLPPLAVFMCGRPMQGLFNLAAWIISLLAIFAMGIGLIGWFLCSVHALLCCRMSSIDKRIDRVVHAIERRPTATSAGEQRP
jgi:uncharacterized membrane protein YqaE (UPF0057 family)